MKHLLFFRHGEAYPYELNNDATRPLTKKGRASFKEIKKAVTQLLDDYDSIKIISSPYARAYESAQIIASFFNQAVAHRFDSIVDGDFEQFLLDLETVEAEAIVIVGHQPTLSDFIYYLTSAIVGFEVAGCAGVDVEQGRPQLMYCLNNQALINLSK
ncbi:MAG: hypothetical protein GX845_03545 [Erysipelothrix sp.]|jgi:phosphohistidine phosphatase SixA|nr:hypothetical protein [Erysipelothrix sp.]